MKIDSLNNNKFLVPQNSSVSENQKKSTEESKVNRDTIHISAEAQKLNEVKVQGKDLEVIKQRISDKYYNSEEIINSVADAILKEIS